MPRVEASNIIDLTDIRQMAGGIGRSTLLIWRRERGFPAPVTVTGGGVELFDRLKVQRWIDRHVITGRGGRPHLAYRYTQTNGLGA